MTPLDEEGRSFYQRRVALLNFAIFALSGGFIVLGSAIPVLTSHARPIDFVSRSMAWHLASVSVAGAVWLFTRRGAHSQRVLAALDATSITAQSVAYAGMAIVARPDLGARADLLVTLIMTVLLTMRAVLIPSTARRTAVVGLVALTPVLVVAYVVGGYYEGRLPSPRYFATVSAVLWSTVAIIETAIASRVVYGLRREVAAARRLGQYTLEEKIGEGGMGEVYKARHALLRRPTAIKVLRRDRAGEHTIERFEREVQLTSQLTHPNTIHVYDFGRTADGSFFYAMEYLDGLSLEELVEIDHAQPPARVIALLAQVCSSLAEAHAIGLIHRDIKPANLVVCERGRLPDVMKVLDFGLVKSTNGGAAVSVTNADAIAGTPAYMAPEAITAADRVDGRLDVYAVGAVAYFLLTGHQVFEAGTVLEMCAHHLHKKPEPPSTIVPGIPADLEAVVLACLAKSPDERPSSALDLRARLLACADATAWTSEDGARWWSENRERVRQHRAMQATAQIEFLTTRIADPRSDSDR